MKFKAVVFTVLSASLLSACGTRYGYQSEDPAGMIPVRSFFSYFHDNRYPSPHESQIPTTIPDGVFNPAEREIGPDQGKIHQEER